MPDRAQRSLHVGLTALFFLLLLLGGGGMRPVEAMLEVLCLAWLLILLWAQILYRAIGREALWPALFVGAIALLPIVQLIPLPYGLWSALPGREIAAEIDRAAGLRELWRPLSLVPEDTRVSALTLLAPLAIFFGVAAIRPEGRASLVRPILGVAMLSAALGALQFLLPENPSLHLSGLADRGQASGIFTYRNIQADFLLIGILAAAFLGRSDRTGDPPRPRLERVLAIAAIPVLALLVIATRSRFGLLMMVPVLLVSFHVVLGQRWRTSLAFGLAGLTAGLAILAIAAPSFIGGTLRRFTLDDRSRTDVIPDLVHAFGTYFPAGSGIGTFDPVFRAAESLSIVDLTYVNHAHNEYLELAIEGGLPAILLILIFLSSFLAKIRTLANVQASTPLLLQRLAALALFVMLLHSLIDYLLRTITTQTIFAYLCAILFLGMRTGRGSGPAS